MADVAFDAAVERAGAATAGLAAAAQPRPAIRSGRGLGDTLYLQSVARHLVARGERPEVCTLWPDVFLPLEGKVDISGFRRDRIDRLAHYSTRKHVPDTDQFTDCCISAGLADVELRLDWAVQNPALTQEVATKADGRPIVLVMLARLPFDRMDGYGRALLPDCAKIQAAIDALGDRVFTVQIGKGEALYAFERLGLDLANKTSVRDLLDIASIADGGLGYCSFLVPLMESFRKPGLYVWSSRGLQSHETYIRQITPQKIFHRREISKSVMDSEGDNVIGIASEFLCRRLTADIAEQCAS